MLTCSFIEDVSKSRVVMIKYLTGDFDTFSLCFSIRSFRTRPDWQSGRGTAAVWGVLYGGCC